MASRGHVDQYQDGYITGWAVDLDKPNEHLLIELVIEDTVVTTVTASQHRADLKRVGIGDGDHAFSIKVPDQFFDGGVYRVTLRIADAGPELRGSPFCVIFGQRPQAKLPLPAAVTPAPVLTLILPTFNRADTLERSVEAYCRCARADEIEIIIIDDGSNDDTPERIASLRTRHANIVTTRIENSGAGRARNIGASLARAPLLLFVGDDVEPANTHFLDVHIKSHEAFPDRACGVLGKITWPADSDFQVNFVMQHVQGEGQQQFGYRYMEPYKFYDWRLFYASNASIKKNLVADWSRDGFDEGFDLYGFEDSEFAKRLSDRERLRGQDYRLLYAPAATLRHRHPHSVASFMRRQVMCGLMAHRFLAKHPQSAADLGLAELIEKLNEPVRPQLPIEHYLTAIEGLKSWALIIEHHHGLGSQNWHADMLKAIFQLTYHEGYLRGLSRAGGNFGAAAKFVIDRVTADLSAAVAREMLGTVAGARLI